MMKLLACMLGLFAIAANSLAAHSGGMLFCEHESGDSHIVSQSKHSSAAHDDACHADAAERHSLSHNHSGACDSCTDTIVDPSAPLDKATSNADRSLVKVPNLLDCLPAVCHALAKKPQATRDASPSRAPPEEACTTLDYYTQTIQLRC